MFLLFYPLAHWFILSYLPYITHMHWRGDSTTYSGLVPQPSISNQEITSSLEANVM